MKKLKNILKQIEKGEKVDPKPKKGEIGPPSTPSNPRNEIRTSYHKEPESLSVAFEKIASGFFPGIPDSEWSLIKTI